MEHGGGIQNARVTATAAFGREGLVACVFRLRGTRPLCLWGGGSPKTADALTP